MISDQTYLPGSFGTDFDSPASLKRGTNLGFFTDAVVDGPFDCACIDFEILLSELVAVG